MFHDSAFFEKKPTGCILSMRESVGPSIYYDMDELIRIGDMRIKAEGVIDIEVPMETTRVVEVETRIGVGEGAHENFFERVREEGEGVVAEWSFPFHLRYHLKQGYQDYKTV